MVDLVVLLAGIVVAAVGGDLFTRGAVGLAAGLRVPPGIIGATIAAFATSAPEMAVGVNAALSGVPQVAAGDALGSNVVNLGLVLGAVVLIAPLALDVRDVRRDLPFAAGAPLLLGLLASDGYISRLDGGALVTVFAIWMGTALLQAIRERRRTAAPFIAPALSRSLLLTVAGGVLLATAGRLVVLGAVGIGEAIGLDAFLVGATLVAAGTSTPELAMALLARLRGQANLSAGTVIGSNIFNTLWIVGVVGLIHPFDLRPAEVGIAVIAGAVGAALLLPPRSWILGRGRGALLLGGYAVYMVALIATG